MCRNSTQNFNTISVIKSVVFANGLIEYGIHLGHLQEVRHDLIQCWVVFV